MKIFISDLDGTLIDGCYFADKSVNKCIQTVVNTGNEFVIASGRTLNGIEALNINYPIYYIALNGALILNKEKEMIYSNAIMPEIIERIYNRYPNDAIEYITAKKSYMIISKETYLRVYSDWDIWQRKMKDNNALKIMLSNYVFDANINQFKEKVLKINILELNEQKYYEKENFIKEIDEIINVPFSKNVLELISNNTSKYIAIEKLMEINGWSKNSIYVFGDGKNDCDMLNNIIHSYAPSNACKEAKKAAKHIIGSCEEQSVLKKIYSLI